MSEVMAWLKQLEEKQKAYHKDRIEQVLHTSVPQHILATKSVVDALAPGTDGFVRNSTGFFFTETLVNRLMYLAYLHGREDIDNRSFQAGYEKALEVARKKLGEV
jgi:hypothetical protein